MGRERGLVGDLKGLDAAGGPLGEAHRGLVLRHSFVILLNAIGDGFLNSRFECRNAWTVSKSNVCRIRRRDFLLDDLQQLRLYWFWMSNVAPELGAIDGENRH